MLTKNKIPFVNENDLKKSFENFKFEKTRIFSCNNNQNLNVGIFTDGDLKRLLQKKELLIIKLKTL